MINIIIWISVFCLILSYIFITKAHYASVRENEGREQEARDERARVLRQAIEEQARIQREQWNRGRQPVTHSNELQEVVSDINSRVKKSAEKMKADAEKKEVLPEVKSTIDQLEL